jgi:lisH domain-containing protein FOPNL
MSRNEIVAEGDLITAVESALQRRGILDKLKAKIRAEVFHTLDDKEVVTNLRTEREIPQDLFLVLELIKDFLTMMKLDNTMSVFCEEMGHSNDVLAVDRTFIGSELGLNTVGSNERVPMLVLLTQFLKSNREHFMQQLHQQQVDRLEQQHEQQLQQQSTTSGKKGSGSVNSPPPSSGNTSMTSVSASSVKASPLLSIHSKSPSDTSHKSYLRENLLFQATTDETVIAQSNKKDHFPTHDDHDDHEDDEDRLQQQDYDSDEFHVGSASGGQDGGLIADAQSRDTYAARDGEYSYSFYDND